LGDSKILEFPKKCLERESVDLGLFVEEPFKAEKRMRHRGLVMLGTALFASLCVIVFWITQTNGWIVLLPFVGLGIVGLAAAFLKAPKMPERTEKGIREAALWSAFGKHLKETSQGSYRAFDS